MKKTKILIIFLMIELIVGLFVGCIPTTPSSPSEITNVENEYKNNDIVLDIPYYSAEGINNGCLCAAGAMIFGYYGFNVSPQELADYGLLMFPETTLNDEFGLFTELKRYAISNLNLKAKYGFLSIKKIKNEIDKGVPIIVLQYSNFPRIIPNLHYRVIHGYNDTEQKFIVSCAQGAYYDLSYSDFLHLNLIENVDKCPSIIIESNNLNVEADVDPKNGTPPHEVHCVGFVSGGPMPYTYQWEFGDGNWSEKGTGIEHRNLFYTYLKSGKYTPILHVEDSGGNMGECTAGVVTVEKKIPFIDGSVFANKQWIIDTDESPGSNLYSDSIENIWLDELGQLHFRMTRDKETKRWKCVEIYSDQQGWGYGKYEFEIEVVSDGKIDENVVIGLFTYDNSISAHKSNNELDIEFSRWGNPDAENGNFVVWYETTEGDEKRNLCTFSVQLAGNSSIHSFEWTNDNIIFDSSEITFSPLYPESFTYIEGDTIVGPSGDGYGYISIPNKERVYMNLWLHNGKPYNEDKMEEVELVIKNFHFEKYENQDSLINPIGAWTITGYDPYCIKSFEEGSIPDRSIVVHWPTVAGTEEYRVYRSVNGDSNFNLVYSGDGMTGEIDVDNRIVWYDFDTTPGNSYSYKVSCVVNGQESIQSDAVTRSVWLPECSLVSPPNYNPEDPNYQPVMEPNPLLEWNPVGVSSYPYQGDIQSGESQIWVVAYNTPYPEVNQGEQIWNESFNDLTTSSTQFDPSTPLIPGPDSIHAWESKGVGFDDNGNILAISWSGARHFFYMEAPDEGIIVQFEDPNLEQVVRETINKPSGPLYLSDVIVITILDAESKGITSLEGIQYLQNLHVLNFNYNQVSDISALSSLTNLLQLEFAFNQVSDISVLANLTNLFLLTFVNNQVSDISALSNLTKLQLLFVGDNQVSDISVLANLTNLTQLQFANNQVSDILVLSNLTNMHTLWFSNNQVSDISVLSNLTNLDNLVFSDNQVSDISSVSNLTNLQWLRFDNNQVTDISALVNNTGLSSGDYISMAYNYLDLSEGSQDMQDIQTLIDRGLDVDYEPQQNIFPDAPVLSGPIYYPPSGTDYDLTWTDVSDGYEIEESKYSNFSSILSGYSTMDTSWTFNHDVTSDTSYYYRVRSLSSEGYYSEWSNKVEVVVNAIKASITVETRDHNSTLISGSFSYILYDDSNPWNAIVNSGSSTSNSYTFDDLEAGTYNIESYQYNNYTLPSYYAAKVDIIVSEGQSKDVTIYTSAISVSTKDNNGNPISGDGLEYVLYLEDGSGNWRYIKTVAAPSNNYTFTKIPSGIYNVEAYTNGDYRGTAVDIYVAPKVLVPRIIIAN